MNSNHKSSKSTRKQIKYVTILEIIFLIALQVI